MAQEDATSKAVSGAKSELAKANKMSSEADPQGMFKPKATKPASAPPPAAKAPMSPSMHSGSVQDLNHQTAAAEGAKVGMTVPIMHKGGTMKKDGLALLQKGETVRTPEQEKAMAEEKMEKPKKEKKSSAESLMTSEDKAPKKEAKSEGKADKKGGKKDGGFTETRVQHHNAGGHHVHHVHKDGSDKDVHYAAQDLEGVKAGLDQHIGGGAGQMMEAPEQPMAAEPAAPPAGAMPAMPAQQV